MGPLLRGPLCLPNHTGVPAGGLARSDLSQPRGSACLGYQPVLPAAHEPVGVAGLTPTVEDKDAGLVGVAPGFDLKRYTVVAVERFAVTGEVNDEEDRKMATMIPDYLLTEVVRQLRASGIFVRIVKRPNHRSRQGRKARCVCRARSQTLIRARAPCGIGSGLVPAAARRRLNFSSSTWRPDRRWL
jgi:hypothetical protein